MLSSLHSPENEQPDSQQEEEQSSLLEAAENRSLVLVVEDNPQMARMITAILAMLYRVSIALDGQEGMEQALALHPDIILCDVTMPRMSGMQLVTELRIRPTFDNVPIVVLSGRTDEQLRIQLLRAGAQDYLVKPFNREELRTRVANLLMVRQTRQILQREASIQAQNLVTLASVVARRQRELTLVNAQLLEREAYLEDQAKELERTNSEINHLLTINSFLEETNRVRGQFLSTMSHELRTPLTSIIGFSQILLDEAEKINYTPRQRSNLERILKNGKHLLLLINDVLDLAKVEAGRMDVNSNQVDVKELIAAVVDETQSIALGQKLLLSYRVEDGLSLATDPLKLRQILLNLLSNALKFTEQGEVTVTATRVTPADDGTESIAIAVKDTGIGITPEDQERIFEAFFQIDGGSSRKFGGTGLGLSIVREMTTLLGGKLALVSSPGQGSTFTITLPIKISENQVKQKHSFSPELSAQAIPKLLLSSSELTSPMPDTRFAVPLSKEDMSTHRNVLLAVDDNPDVLILIKSALEDTSFEVVGIQDPLQVIDMVHKLQPSVITLDVMMPDLNGWQILHELKTDPATASIPVVMLTILSERSTGYVLGADEYLIKPFKTGVLLETLHRLVSSNPPSPDRILEQKV